MPNLPISSQQIRQYADDNVFQRGKQYAASGAVRALLLRGAQLEAQVEGSEFEPYRVRVTFDAAGATEATCTCPYDWGGWCKHIVAALLAALDHPKEIEERLPVEEQVTALDDEQREALLIALARDPNLADAVEQHLAQLAFQQSQTEAAQGRRTRVDADAFRRTLLHTLRASGSGYNDYYDDYTTISLDEPLAQIRPFVEGEDSANALALLEVLTEEVAEAVHDEIVYPEGIELQEVDSLWAEALLIKPLAPKERQAWGKKLLAWDGKLDDYEMGGSLAGAQLAAEQGWDGEMLQAWRRGEPWDEEDGDNSVAGALLRLLERRGEDETYLNVARATGAGAAYLLKLVALGKGEQAANEAEQWLRTPGQALTLAQALREQGNLDGALRIGEHGLSLHRSGPSDLDWRELWEGHPASRHAMASWLAELAEGMGRRDVALRASELAFRDKPTVAGYERVRDLAGDEWDNHYHAPLLQHLRERGFSMAAEPTVSIFLNEGRLEDAMRTVEKIHQAPLVQRVMRAVLATHPDWVVEQALKRAEPIMREGKASHYDEAVAWLRHARDAYRASGRADEWQRYRAGVEATHGRKHKLMGLMKGL